MQTINLEQFNKLSSFIEKSKLKKLIDDFFDPDTSGKNTLISSLSKRDSENIRKQAHYIKGSASFLGMQGIMEHCIFIETEIKENPHPNFEKLISDLQSVWESSYLEAQNLVN